MHCIYYVMLYIVRCSTTVIYSWALSQHIIFCDFINHLCCISTAVVFLWASRVTVHVCLQSVYLRKHKIVHEKIHKFPVWRIVLFMGHKSWFGEKAQNAHFHIKLNKLNAIQLTLDRLSLAYTVVLNKMVISSSSSKQIHQSNIQLMLNWYIRIFHPGPYFWSFRTNDDNNFEYWKSIKNE